MADVRIPSPRHREHRPAGLVVAQFPHRSAINPALNAFARSVEQAGAHVLPHDVLPGDPDRFASWVHKHIHRLDVLHLHWFQRLYLRRNWLRTLTAIRRLLHTLRAARRAGVAITWTVHNLLPHERPYPWLDTLAHRLVARLVDRAYVEAPTAVPSVVAAYPCLRCRVGVVPLGSYTSIYQGQANMREARERLGLPADATIWLAFGLIRRYKQVPELITTFADTFAGDPSRVLLVAGEPHNAVERARIERSAAGAKNVVLQLERVREHDVPTVLAATNYVVCNYRGSFNSGVALLAASFGRAVLAPTRSTADDMPSGAVIPIQPSPTGTRDALLDSASACWSEVGEAAFDWARHRTWQRTGAMIVEAWRELALQCRVSALSEINRDGGQVASRATPRRALRPTSTSAARFKGSAARDGGWPAGY